MSFLCRKAPRNDTSTVLLLRIQKQSVWFKENEKQMKKTSCRLYFIKQTRSLPPEYRCECLNNKICGPSRLYRDFVRCVFSYLATEVAVKGSAKVATERGWGH